MRRLKSYVLVFTGFALLAGCIGLIAWGVNASFRYLSSIPKEIAAPLIAASATVFVATLTVMVGRYYERKKELDTLYRDKKTEIYDEFLREFFSLFFSAGQDGSKTGSDLVPFFREFTRKLVLWSGPEVIEAFVAWKDHLAKGKPDAKAVFLTEAFLLAIRKDLRHSNSSLRKGFFARLVIREGELLLAMAEKDPNVTLFDLEKMENAMAAQAAAVHKGA